jgi:hypothetical protein
MCIANKQFKQMFGIAVPLLGWIPVSWEMFYFSGTIKWNHQMKRIHARISLWISGSCLVISLGIVHAQDTQKLTLERIYQENDFRMNRFGPVRWLEDGSGFTTLEGSEAFKGPRDSDSNVMGKR